jgi:hypothetical protein
MNYARMEPTAGCYAVLLQDPLLRSIIASPRESRPARSALQVAPMTKGSRGPVGRLRDALAERGFARIVRSPAH